MPLIWRDAALQLQDGHRPHRQHLHHLRAAPSAGIEPIPANIYTPKTPPGLSWSRTLPWEALLQAKAKDSTNVWNSILEQGGSVQHLDFLARGKGRHKTSFELDQRWLLEFAADRTPYIDQAQSLNPHIPADVDKWDPPCSTSRPGNAASSRSTTSAANRSSARRFAGGSRPTTRRMRW